MTYRLYAQSTGTPTTKRESTIMKRELDTQRDALVQIAELIAEHEQTDVRAMPPMYDELGDLDLLEHVFDGPETADLAVSFTYNDHHVTINRDGTATLNVA